jgi:hypothetical protein
MIDMVAARVRWIPSRRRGKIIGAYNLSESHRTRGSDRMID